MMRDDLLGYYERELVFLRQLGAEFADKYPKVAGRLLLEPDKCEDPHVERLIESFAFLAGRIRLKIDDEFPEITESLLNVLYPHYLAPIPSMSVAQFSLDPDQTRMTTGYTIDRGTLLYSRPIQGTACRFQTCFATTLWPIEVVGAALESEDPVDSRGRWSKALLRVGLRCMGGVPLSAMCAGDGPALDRLRFYLDGEPQLVYPLYELLFNNLVSVEVREATAGKAATASRSPRRALTLPEGSVAQVGFARDEGMLPYTARSFPGYRLLTEYFAFPNKFLFFDVTGLEAAVRAGFGERFEIVMRLRDVRPPAAAVDAETFRLGCTPIVNLFRKVAEPIQLTQQRSEYRVIPDVHRQTATEVYAVESVTTADPYLERPREFQPFYSFRHGHGRDAGGTFWYTTRRPSQRKDDFGTEVYLSLVDLGFNPNVPALDTATVHVTCTNRDLPSRLPFGDRDGDFDLEEAIPLARIRCLTKPTPTWRPPLRRGAQWRLISHLTLNHLSLVDDAGTGSPDALREILALYDFTDSPAARRQIAGVESVTSRRVVRQTGSRIGAGFVRGIETTVDFDETQYVGSGVFLFACVLERFLGLYASLNSFNTLVATTRQREGSLKRWPPRAGERILV
jgi:type VI secretion system protein ImpG